MTVYPIKSKDEVSAKFKEFITFSKPLGVIEKIRTDGGGEYLSTQFESLCKEYDIVHQYSVPYKPHQNGTAERSHYTLQMKARCMINSTDLGHKVWPYAYMYAAYVYNRSYINRIDNTPYSFV